MTIRMSSGLRTAVVTNYGVGIMMQYGHILIFSGAQPASADDAPPGTLVARVTQNGLPAPVPGSDAGGLQLKAGARTGELANLGEWVLKGVAPGTPGWWRFVALDIDPGQQSTTACRIDGAVGESLLSIPPSITAATTLVVEGFSLRFPA